MTGREGINTLAQEFPDLPGGETRNEIIWPDSHTLLNDTSYGWVSIVASGTQSGVASLAAFIARVKGAKRLGIRIGNWLTADQGKALLQGSCSETLRGKRDHAILAVLLGCGLRRAETAAIRIEDLQLREEHRVIADLVGKGRHVRTLPMPGWVKDAVDEWSSAAGISGGVISRRINKEGKVWGPGLTSKAIWHVVKTTILEIENLQQTISGSRITGSADTAGCRGKDFLEAYHELHRQISG